MASKDQDIPVKIKLTDKTGQEIGSATVNAPGSHTFNDLSPGKTYISTLTPPDEYKVVTDNPKRYTLKDTFKEQEKSLTIEIFLDKSPILGGVGQRKAGSPDTPVPDSVLISALVGFVLLLLASDILGFLRDEPPPVVTVSPQANSTVNSTVNSTQVSPAQTSSTPAVDTSTSTDAFADLTDRSPNSSSLQTQVAGGTGEVLIVGEDVNVRLDPDIDSPVIAQISHGLVQIDVETIAATPGWQAVVLPDGTRGYVAAQYVEFPGGISQP